MSVKAFEPKFMKVGVLTAALQELTPREKRDPDPDLAIEEWVQFASELGVNYIQLGSALHPSESDIPAEAMLDPTANHLDLRQPFNPDRAKRVRACLQEYKVGISEVGYFDNMLHHDPALRKKKHDFMLRIMDSAVALDVSAVCGFVGRNQQTNMDQNLLDFEEWFIPLLKAAKERGLVYRIEQCPMPGWAPGDNWHNNIAYTPGTWIGASQDLRKTRRRRPIPDSLRSVARHPDGPGHALAVPIPERRRLQLPDRRLPRQRSGD